VRLIDLDATFIAGPAAGEGHRRVATMAEAQGLLFQCPACAQGKERAELDGRRVAVGAHYVRVWFSSRGAPYDATPLPRWLASGTNLDDLTLAPSIAISGGCRWHGYVRNGDAA